MITKNRIIDISKFLIFFVLTVVLVGIKNTFFVLIAAGIHEFGHLIAIQLVSSETIHFKLGLGGFEIIYAGSLSYKNEIIVAAAGPLLSLFAAMLISSVGRAVGFNGSDFFAGINFLYCVFNLLPISFLDGGKILYALLSWSFNDNLAYKTMKILNMTLTVLLVMIGIYALLCCYNPTLFICALLLFNYCCKS